MRRIAIVNPRDKDMFNLPVYIGPKTLKPDSGPARIAGDSGIQFAAIRVPRSNVL